MTALFVIASRESVARNALTERADRSMRKQGFAAPQTFHWDFGILVWYPTPETLGSSGFFSEDSAGCIACVGTFFFDGKTGNPALQEFLKAFDESCAAELQRRTEGNYVLFMTKEGKSWFSGDRLGLIRLYHAPTISLFSTSWLVALDCIGAPVLQKSAAQEYIIEGANHGVATPVEQIVISKPAAIIRTDASVVASSSMADWLCVAEPSDIDAAVDAATSILRRSMQVIVNSFRGRIRCSLSGGFDSRLIVAALMAIGERPECFVYGSTSDEDVRIARELSRLAGLKLRHYDKDALDFATSPLEAEGLEQNIGFFDGIPPDGVFDRGSDRSTRIAQSRDGRMALNGGGGEILRNFFYLRDRPFSATQIVQTFYSGYLAAAFPGREQLIAYQRYMVENLESLTGKGVLDRKRVELVYPLFRNRYWAGRNNSLAVRVGDFYTPLLDPRLVEFAATLPMSWKCYGIFESMLISRLSPDLARVPLTYGFSPARGPNFGYRTKMWLQQLRPPALRRYSPRIKSLLGRIDKAGVPLEHRRLLPGPLEINEVIRLDELLDPAQVSRAMTLEALIRRSNVTVR